MSLRDRRHVQADLRQSLVAASALSIKKLRLLREAPKAASVPLVSSLAVFARCKHLETTVTLFLP